MRKLYYIDKLETKMSKAEIEEKVREIVSENQIFNIGVMACCVRGCIWQCLKKRGNVFAICYTAEHGGTCSPLSGEVSFAEYAYVRAQM